MFGCDPTFKPYLKASTAFEYVGGGGVDIIMGVIIMIISDKLMMLGQSFSLCPSIHGKPACLWKR